jgi:DinB superfamily
MMNPNRKLWNENQKYLHDLLDRHESKQALVSFFIQHAAVHSAQISASLTWSFADEILKDIPDDIWRRIPAKAEHSIAWCVFHIARCEDVAMNILVADEPQIIHQNDWLHKMCISIQHTGNEMSYHEIFEMSKSIDIHALESYRLAVGCKTEQMTRNLKPEQLFNKVLSSRVQRVRSEGAVTKAAEYVLDYWSKRTLAGLLLMPATRHNFVHLNEALQLKNSRK